MAAMYFTLLVSLRAAVFSSRFQTKPVKVISLLQGWSFSFSQGIPSCSEMLSMSSMLQEYLRSSSDRGEDCDRSWTGNVMSSSNSSVVPFVRSRPPYQRLLPSRCSPPSESIDAFHSWRFSLYSSIFSLSIQKKT